MKTQYTMYLILIWGLWISETSQVTWARPKVDSSSSIQKATAKPASANHDQMSQDQTNQPSSDSNTTPFKEPQDFIESEQILSTNDLWKQDGLRVDLAYYDATVSGFAERPSGLIQGIHIGVGTRLDESWSLDGVLRYGLGKSGLGGLNFSGSISPTYHIYGFGLGLGVGVIGVDEQSEMRRDPYPELNNEVVASYTLPKDSATLSSCSGFGPMVLLNALYRFPVTTVFAFKVGAQIDLARLACEQDTDRVEPDSAQGIVIRQYWDRWSWSLFGGLSWR